MNSRSAFVAIGLGVNLLVLVRSLALMVVLDYEGLGLIALVQSSILLAGMMHFGLLNGGYRLLCHAGPAYRQRIVNLAYSVFALVALGIVIVAAVIMVQFDTQQFRIAAVLGAIGGIATLVRSWMMNEMLASGRLKGANIVNAGSIAVSLGLLVFLPYAPSEVAIASIVAQPLVFVLLALALREVTVPNRFGFRKRLLQVIYKAGFVMFLTGLSVQLNAQIERTYVTTEIGLEQLGRLYLAFLFLTLFQLVPTLLEQVFLPVIVRARKIRDYATVKAELRRMLLLDLGYCAVAAVALALLAEPVLEFVLPKYAGDLRWVYLLAPGLFALTLASPFALTYNVVIDYTWYVIAYGAGTAITLIAFGAALLLGQAYSLDGVILLRSGICVFIAVMMIVGWWQISRRHAEFRMFSAPLAADRASV